MRTTLTLEPDVAELIRRETQDGRVSLKKIVNQRLRMGFGLKTAPKPNPFKVHAHPSGLMPGLDPQRLNQIADDLEAEAARDKLCQSLHDHT